MDAPRRCIGFGGREDDFFGSRLNDASCLPAGHRSSSGPAGATGGNEMIEVQDVIAWSAVERSIAPGWGSAEIDILSNDLRRAVRFYARVFGLLPAPGAWGESVVVIPVTADTRLVIHDAQPAVRRKARCVKRWGFV